jgi:hypothetical protein
VNFYFFEAFILDKNQEGMLDYGVIYNGVFMGSGGIFYYYLNYLLNQPSQQEEVADEAQQPVEGQAESMDAPTRQASQSVPSEKIADPQPHGMLTQPQLATEQTR